jgi:hypothetical protein
MSVIQLYRERLPMHPLLGRHVNLDSRSKSYAIQPKTVTVTSIRHDAHIPILNQGQIGSCTGNASTSCAYHAPFYAPQAPIWRYGPDEEGAVDWYRDNTANDDFPGTYTPDDTGSDGLTSSKMAVAAGVASGYQAALDLDSSLQTLMDRPGITGLPWYNSMFNVGSNGLIEADATSGLAGGHELCVDEIVARDASGNGTGQLLVGGPNSWSNTWGATGRWYLRSTDWWELRRRQGDVYFWTAKSQPSPSPTPDPSDVIPSLADREMWAATEPFRHDHHVVPHIVQAAKALGTWGTRVGLA